MRIITIRLCLMVTIVLAVACSSTKNSGGPLVTADNQTFQLKHDTLYSGSGQKFFKGQKLIVGLPAGDDGYYRSIVYKTALVPSIWGQDKRFDHAIENHVNVKKSRESVKQFLTPGTVLTIKRIRLSDESKPHFYMVSLATESNIFDCDLQFALFLNELKPE